MLTVHIIGTGPGSSELLTKSAEKALNEATIVVGDTRLLSEMTEGKRCIQTYKVDEIRQIVLEADEKKDCLAVLVSGDVVFIAWPSYLQIYRVAESFVIPVSAVSSILRHARLRVGMICIS